MKMNHLNANKTNWPMDGCALLYQIRMKIKDMKISSRPPVVSLD